MKVLLVDDEPGIREGLAMLLRRRGHEVVTAGDCGVAAARLNETVFDVVVTDWRLPDGLAAAFLADCSFPALVVSGHPEEVERAACVQDVLTKPVTPTRLLAAIAGCGASAGGAVEADEPPPLPRDVVDVVTDFVAQLPPGAEIEQLDDGTFLTVRATLPVGAEPRVRNHGGDLRWRRGNDRSELELRLCRDGRPDIGAQLVPFGCAWPARGELAIDCAAANPAPDELVAALDRARFRRLAGQEACFVNLPPSLVPTIAVWERTREMPMRGRVGPRLQAELVELWS